MDRSVSVASQEQQDHEGDDDAPAIGSAIIGGRRHDSAAAGSSTSPSVAVTIRRIVGGTWCRRIIGVDLSGAERARHVGGLTVDPLQAAGADTTAG